ncbi:hypothetical protein [Flavobacterium kingsejongi]|uniref:Uncharacterized protein n=1 Tax=Flavobacterium kingsejongi TaxID=1678728 RepID=A0A2S1LLE5_9FLAO|nr:hypothetical protein [Flavobacterium kingsejongi]AWG24580.1 hypothetical protein FK004_04730 [Flavobacterium kingsejongi]
MEKLTREQVATIERILQNLGIVYIDFKEEILDHMILEIEHKMQEKTISFEEASKEVIQKWSRELVQSSSGWFGMFWSLPRIIMKSCIGVYKKMLLQHLGYALINTVIIVALIRYAGIGLEVFSGLVDLVFIGSSIVMLGGFYTIIRSKQKTIFRFLYERQLITVFLIYVQKVLLNLGNPDFDAFSILGLCRLLHWSILIVYPVMIYQLYQSHFEKIRTRLVITQ